MKIGLLFTLGVFLICTHARAEQLFEVCDNVVDSSNYKPLKEYLSETIRPNNLCQRLTNHEFLYTDDRNIYYCNAKNTPLSCKDHEDGTWFPNTSVTRRFSGKNGKKYVLLKTSRLSQGVFASGYHAFFLVPKSVDPKGYIIFRFAGAGEHNGSYSDGGQVCDNLGDVAEALTSTSVPFDIVNEGQSNPIVRFNQEITSCKTGEVFNQTLEYTWLEGAFQKTIDKKEAIQPKKKGNVPATGLTVSFASTETVVTAAQVNGTWSSGGNTFKVLALGNQKLKVEFFGTYYYESNWGPTTNTGEASGIAIIKGDTAIFKPDEENKNCIIIMKFTEGKLVVEQENMCPFGFNVSAADTYQKVSKKKPKFKE